VSVQDQGRERLWAADHVERRNLADLVPYARNARMHSPRQIEQIRASMQEFGWTIPVLVDEANVLIAGHGRILAAEGLGITTVPTMVARGWTEAQIAAYRLTDNQLTMNSEWEPELLRLELGELKMRGFDLDLTGFDRINLDALLGDGVEGSVDPTEEWQGAPEYAHEEQGATQQIVVNFATREAVAAFGVLIGQSLTEHTRSIWYPPAEIGRTSDKRYVADGAPDGAGADEP
jgi:hypothetical protein